MGLCWDCVGIVVGVFCDCFSTVWDCLGIVFDRFGMVWGIVLGLFWDCVGIVLGLFLYFLWDVCWGWC